MKYSLKYDTIEKKDSFGVKDRLENIEIQECKYLYLFRFINYSNDKIATVKQYCLDRFLKMVLYKARTESFEVILKDGYYGDEIDKVICTDLDLIDRINKFIEMLNNIKDTELHIPVEAILMREYGYILPRIKDKAWAIDKIQMNNIILSCSTRTINNETIEYYNDGWEDRDDWNNRYCSFPALTCLCSKESDGYHVIDGRHRYLAAKNRNSKKMTVVYCTQGE